MAKNVEAKKRTVIIAMDGSKTSDKAFDFYMKYLHTENDDAILLHCVHHKGHIYKADVWLPLNPQNYSEAFQEEERSATEACQKLQTKIDQIQKKGNISVTKIHGDPGPCIVQKAHECKASVVIVGSRGLGTIRRTILGSVSDYILHHADVPVLICPQ